MADLLFNFRDLTSVSDSKIPMLNLSSLVIPDSVVRSFNPKRYNFYIKFINGLTDPSNLYKFLYTTKDSKAHYNDIQSKISLIAKGLKKLSSDDKNLVISNLKKVLDTTNNDSYNNLFSIIQSYEKKGGAGEEYGIKKPLLPMNTFLTHINKEKRPRS